VALKIRRIEHPIVQKLKLAPIGVKMRPFDKAINKRKEEEHGIRKIFQGDNFIFTLLVIVCIGLRA
jgi:hypothetical protein